MQGNKGRYISTRIRRLFMVFGALFLASLLTLLYVVRSEDRHVIFAVVPIVILIVACVMGYRYIFLPYRETEKLLRLFVTGYTIEETLNLRYPLSPEMEAAIDKIRDLYTTKELISASKRQAQYLALQNQINPHFLYNTLEGIRSDAIAAGVNDIAEMTEALATFFRYTISNLENLVTLEDELQNAENYFHIQQYRFGARFQLQIEYDPHDEKDIFSCKLQKLTLQPIVENAIIHGLEQKVSGGLLRIRLELTAARLLITVSDNGIGMPESKIEALNAHLNAAFFESEHWEKRSHGGIALINVNNRIKLLFGEEYGIYIYSIEGRGTDVQITLPRMLDDKSLRKFTSQESREQGA